MNFQPPLFLLTIVLAGAVALTFAPASLTARQGCVEHAAARNELQGARRSFNKIAERASPVGTGSLVVMSNAAIIEGDSDVLVVDSHQPRRRLGAAGRTQDDPRSRFAGW